MAHFSQRFSRRIARAVRAELVLARRARATGNPAQEFQHLENAHVLGQGATYWHVRVHGQMFCWAWRNRCPREWRGQLLRIAGALTKTALGWVPAGNTGGANVSPFLRMPVPRTLDRKIQAARKAN